MSSMERREAVRWDVSLPAQIGLNQQSVNGRVLDISRYGAMLEMPAAISPAMVLSLVAVTKKDFRLHLEGKAVWVKQVGDDLWRLGVRFVGNAYDIDKAVWQCVLDTFGLEGSHANGKATTLAETYFTRDGVTGTDPSR